MTTRCPTCGKISQARSSRVSEPGPAYNGPMAVEAQLAHLKEADQEHFCVIYTDARHRAIETKVHTIGTQTCSLVDIKAIMKHAMEVSSAAIILVHNHPSGNPEPSLEDIQVTKRVEDACNFLDIILLDHVILAREGFRSLRQARHIMGNTGICA